MDQTYGQPPTATPADLELILQIGLQISAERDLERVLCLSVERIKAALNYAYCAVLLKEGQDLVIRAVTSYPDALIGRRVAAGQGLTGRCAEAQTEVLVADVTADPAYVHFGDESFRSELDVPIVFRGRLLGVLNTQSREVAAFRDRDLHVLRILGTQLGVAIYNARIRGQLELVQDIGIQLAAITRPELLFPWIVTQIRDRLGHDSCAILKVDGAELVFEASTGGYSADLLGLRIPFGRGITGRCALEQRPVNVGDVRAEASYLPSGIEGVRSEIASPILFEDQLHGVLTIESVVPHAFDDDDVRLLSTLSAQVAVGLRQARLIEDAQRMAVTDPLTGLYNYRYFYDRLRGEMARSTRYGHPLSLVMVDLDDFKAINDRHGHLRGDDVLREVAQTLRRNTRSYDEPMTVKHTDVDIASRYGGEEFIVIMPDTGAAGAEIAAERLRAAVEAEVGTRVGLTAPDGPPIPITGSFGVAAFERGQTPEAFIKRADDAVYAAKAAGKNQVAVADQGCPPQGRVG